MRSLAVSNHFINALIRKNNKHTLKLLLYTLKKSDIERETSENFYLSLSMKEINKIYKNNLKNLRQDFQKIQKTTITIKEKQNITDIQLIKKIYYDIAKQRITLEIDSLIINEFKNLENNFTIIDINNIIKLNNKHASRMILILEQINNYSKHINKVKEYSLNEMNKLFDTNYKSFKEIERTILKTVQKELNEFARLTFLYDFQYDIMKETKGRKPITGVKLILQENKIRQLKFDI